MDAQAGDGVAAEGGHGAGCVAGADAGGVFAEADVARVVQAVLDGPFGSGERGEPGRGGLGGGQAGDAEGGDVRAGGLVQAADVTFDQEHLTGVRERQAGGGGQDLDGAGLVPPVAAVLAGVRDLVSSQGRALIASNRDGWFSLTKRATDYDVSVPGCRARWWSWR